MRRTFAAPAIIALSGAMILGACGASGNKPTATGVSATTAAIASPATTRAATPVSAASPAVSPSSAMTTATARSTSTATPMSSAAATPTGTSTATGYGSTSTAAATAVGSNAKVTGPVDLSTAFNNLVSQNSYQFVAQVQNLPGVLSTVPGITSSNTITIDASGNDRHVKVVNSSNATILELWRVNNQTWASAAGSPAVQANSSTPIVGQLLPLLDADKLIVGSLAGQGVNYAVAGTEEVNGVAAQRETATYQVSPPANPIIPAGSYTVNSQLWVAQTGGYLVQGILTLGQGTATPGTSSPSVKMTTTQVGKPITITPPA